MIASTGGPPANDRAPIAVGVDTSDESLSALTAALQLGRRLDAPVTVVHAVGLLEEGGYRMPPAIDDFVTAARHAAGIGEEVPVNVMREDGPAADVLTRVAGRIGATMIVVGRRGLGSAPRPLGSVSEAVLARATTPVLVVPPAPH